LKPSKGWRYRLVGGTWITSIIAVNPTARTNSI
jgi:hypothetical protein